MAKICKKRIFLKTGFRVNLYPLIVVVVVVVVVVLVGKDSCFLCYFFPSKLDEKKIKIEEK